MWLYRILVILVLARWIERSAGLWLGWRRLPALREIPPADPGSLPRLSIVVPALNEESTAGEAMKTLLALDYPDLEIIAVDDRSTDSTGEILDRLAARDSRLKVIHVKELPDGWLGKTHAMHVGSREATGSWILFTDADVHFEPTALRRAVGYAEAEGADHLVATPDVVARGFWEIVFLSFFWIIFAFHWEPRKASDPGSRAYVGVGAFNLVRAEAYRRAGGHAAMPLEVIDDVMLGKLLKLSGARQACIPSGGLVKVRWIEGLGGAIRGLTKNMFAGLRFNPLMAVLSSAVLFTGAILPALGLFVGPWDTRIACAAIFACMAWATRTGVMIPRLSPLYGLTFPAGAAILIYIIYRSMLLTYVRGGIVWRGTHYPLSSLRRGLV